MGEPDKQKAWVVYLEPFEGGFTTVKVEPLPEGETYLYRTAPFIVVPLEMDVKDEIGAFLYAKRILDNLQLNEGAKK